MKWKINFDISNSNFNLIGYAASGFIKHIPPKDGRQLFTEWYLVHEDGRTWSYVPVLMMKEVINWIKDKIVSDPDWAFKLHEKATDLNTDYFNLSLDISKKDLSKLSNEELASLYVKIRKAQLPGHTHAVSTTWFLDCDGDVYSNYLREELQKHLRSVGINGIEKIMEYLTLLTTPTKENLAQKELLDFLNLLKLVQEDMKVVNIFKEFSVNEILAKLPDQIKDKIYQHFNKWKWTPYGYIGPAYQIDFYLEEIKKQIDIKNIDDLILEEKNRNAQVKSAQEKLIKDIGLPGDLLKYFLIAQEIIWLKDYRKYCIWHGHYVLDMITKEIARRLMISHKQANYFFNEEVEQVLSNGGCEENTLNDRIKFCVIWANEDTQKIYYGDEARQIIDNLEIEETKVDLSEGFKGTCAFPGKVEGPVKILNSADDINKVQEGDILLAMTTYPAFLPAMKKAKAIVTEDGGITCHAAIVARELRIPCVVGAKQVTRLLQDGDLVNVDATNGIVIKV